MLAVPQQLGTGGQNINIPAEKLYLRNYGLINYLREGYKKTIQIKE